ncbi:response regulator transcription factor [Komagataeibacter intermedius]|nr:response regulator transcription factor [Komagataeibacter intermedius]
MKKPVFIRVAMLEDDPLFHAAMARAIAAQADMVLHATATSRAGGLAMLAGPPADVLVADIGLPDGSGLDVVREACRRWPGCAVLVSTAFSDETHVMDAIACGATGYLLKDSEPGQQGMVDIRNAHQGGSPISPMVARRVLARFRQHLPSPAERALPAPSGREREVLLRVSQGFTTIEIARQLDVSAHTVQTHIRRIYRKLAVATRIEAVTTARRQGWLA